MIIGFEDLLEEMYEEFPDINEKSIRKICKDGLIKSKTLVRSGRELLIKCPKMVEIKFYIPSTQENQFVRTKINEYKDKRKKDGNSTSEV